MTMPIFEKIRLTLVINDNKKIITSYNYERKTEFKYKTFQRYFEYINNRFVVHRDNLPAEIYYYPNGNVEQINYINNGILHNYNDAAVIIFNKNNKIIKKIYYINDEKINVRSLKSFKNYIKTLIL